MGAQRNIMLCCHAKTLALMDGSTTKRQSEQNELNVLFFCIN